MWPVPVPPLGLTLQLCTLGQVSAEGILGRPVNLTLRKPLRAESTVAHYHGLGKAITQRLSQLDTESQALSNTKSCDTRSS